MPGIEAGTREREISIRDTYSKIISNLFTSSSPFLLLLLLLLLLSSSVNGGAVLDTAQLHDLLQLLGDDPQVILDLAGKLLQRQQLALNVLQLLLQIDLRCDQLLDPLLIDLRRDARHLPLDLVQNALARRPLLLPPLSPFLLLLLLLLANLLLLLLVQRRYNRLPSLGLALLLRTLRFGLRFWPRFRFSIRSVARLRSGRRCRLNSRQHPVTEFPRLGID